MRANYLRATALATVLLTTVFTAPAHATAIEAATDGRWYQFDVDELMSGNLHWIDAITDDEGLYQGDFSDVSFTFTLNNAGALTVVDGGIAGDEFDITINGESYTTSSVSSISSSYAGTDFDAALADSNFSMLTVHLAAGTYTVSGALLQSAIDDSETPYNATVGGLRVTEVPLPASAWMFGTALAAVIAHARRRA